MRVLISSTKFSGHLNPLLPYADALIAMGHDVAVAAPKAVSQRLAQAGIVHLPVGEAAEEDAEASRQRKRCRRHGNTAGQGWPAAPSFAAASAVGRLVAAGDFACHGHCGHRIG